MKALEEESFQKLCEIIRDQKPFKIFGAIRLLDLALQARLKHEEFWITLKEALILNTEFDNANDVAQVLSLIANNSNFDDDFWIRMGEKALHLKNALTLIDLIEIFQTFKEGKKIPMIKPLIQTCKQYVVEEIDTVNIRETLQLMEMFQSDISFKKFIGRNLRDKIVKNQNLTMQELMASITLSLDLEELRNEMITFALNSEIFYAFPTSYYITILQTIEKLSYNPAFDDLIRAIQIQLCIQDQPHQSGTIHKLIRLHLTIPVLNAHFLTMLLRGYNSHIAGNFHKKLDYSPFQLNISMMNLPKIENPQLIEEYEIALTNYLKIETPEQFNAGIIIKFFNDNEMFAKHGFFKGFSTLVFTTIMSDSRSMSDVWLLSVIQKILTYEVQDPEFVETVEKLVDKNFDRYSNTALQKLIVLIARNPSMIDRYRDILLKKIRSSNPELLYEVRIQTQSLISLAKIDYKKQDQFMRFFEHTMKQWYSFNFVDVYRVLFSLQVLGHRDNPDFQESYSRLLEKTIQLVEKIPNQELMFCLESLSPYLKMFPQSLHQQKYDFLKQMLTNIEEVLFGPNKKILFLLLRYQKIIPKIQHCFESLDQDDPSLKLVPTILRCQVEIDDLIRVERENQDSGRTDEDEDDQEEGNYHARLLIEQHSETYKKSTQLQQFQELLNEKGEKKRAPRSPRKQSQKDTTQE